MRRVRPAGQQVSLGVAGLAAVAACILGSGATIAAFWDPTPSRLADPARADGAIPVERDLFRDPQPVELAATLSTPAQVLSTGNGTLTSYDCRPGESVMAGQVLARVNSAPVVALATDVPLWRTITPGSTGGDVDAIHRELRRLKVIVSPVPPAGTAAGFETVQALARLGGLSSSTSQISADAFAWIPQPTVRITKCPTTVGAKVSLGSPLFELAPRVTDLSLKSTPTSSVLGARQLIVDTASVNIDNDGTISSPQGLQKVLRTRLLRAFMDSDGKIPLQATWSLRRALEVASLPASTVTVAANVACVSKSGVAVPIQIVTSELGKTIVIIDRDVRSIDSVPPDDFTCT